MRVKLEALPDVEEVILKTTTGELVIKNPLVNVLNVKGEKIFQITGKLIEKPSLTIPDEDIQLVSQQTGVSADEARKALEQTGGDLATAILLIREKGKP
jgi:nascent polypeptide-associated complex subunit alpha